jgi:hypothetical protein
MAHTTEQMAFIVQRLAEYASPDVIALEFSVKFRNVPCALADVRACERDRLTPEWQAVFDRAREAFLAAPTADSRVRVAELHRMFVAARDRNAVTQAAELLAQIKGETEGSPGGSSPAGVVTAITRTIVHPERAP